MFEPAEITAQLDALITDQSLYIPENVAARADALEFVALVEQVIQLRRQDHRWGGVLSSLKQRASAFKRRLQTSQEQLLQGLRATIQGGQLSCDELRALFNRYTSYRPNQVGRPHWDYEPLDLVIHGLIRADQITQTSPPEAEMVHLEATPARVVLELIDTLQPRPNDVFYDLGAGLGNIAILVSLFSEARVMGIEIDPDYCAHARQTAVELGQPNIAFLNQDVRATPFNDGTIFFMFTPFTGQILQTVLAKLAAQAANRSFIVCTYGTCTLEVAQQPWLHLRDSETNHAYKLAVFKAGA